MLESCVTDASDIRHSWIRHSSFRARQRIVESELCRRDVVEPLAKLSSQLVGQARSLRISVAVGNRVEPIERKASCKRVL
jgi:hypothetical protein